MKNSKTLKILIILGLLTGCSFDSKTGIWDSSKGEKERIASIKDKQNSILSSKKVYSSKAIYYDEILSNIPVVLSKPINIINWKMPNLNEQNFKGNIYLSGVSNNFFKKKNWKEKIFFF